MGEYNMSDIKYYLPLTPLTGEEGIDAVETSFQTDVGDKGDSYMVCANMPGFSLNQISIKIDGADMLIHAVRPETTDAMKIPRGLPREFKKNIKLPGPVADCKISCNLLYGILVVRIPKVKIQ